MSAVAEVMYRNEAIYASPPLEDYNLDFLMNEVLVDEQPVVEIEPAYEDTSPAIEALPIEERVLFGVDYLLSRRRPDGTYADSTLEAAHVCRVTATKEMAIPHAISRIYMDKVAEGVYMSDDQTSVEVAESGLKYHRHPAARARASVEIDEARHNASALCPSKAHAFISPRMPKADAPVDVAKEEHLADDDALRITGLITDETGVVKQMYMEAILVRDIPLEAWVAMLRSPDNIFGKQIIVEDGSSALSVMKVFKELELSSDTLPDGVKGLVRAVLPYITDTEARQSVEEQYEKLHSNQEEIHVKATSIADRWLAFDIEMAESLSQKRATPYIQKFIGEFDGSWGDTTKNMIAMHALGDGGLFMTRELAIKVEEARVKTLWLKAAVANNNETVIAQMDPSVVAQIIINEDRIQTMALQGYAMHQMLESDSSNNKVVAQQEVRGGGGCPGDIKADILTGDRRPGEPQKDASQQNKADKEKDEVLKCVKCPLCKKDGVDAKIEHFAAKKRITCSSCRGFKEYKK